MSKMIQVRNVPDDVHRALKVRAAASGMTLSDYVLREVEALARRPTAEELLARIRHRGHPPLRVDTAAAVRAEREGRR